LILHFPVLERLKNICFSLFPFWKSPKTLVFCFSRFGKVRKLLFFAFPVLGKSKNICFCIFPFWKREKMRFFAKMRKKFYKEKMKDGF